MLSNQEKGPVPGGYLGQYASFPMLSNPKKGPVANPGGYLDQLWAGKV